MKATVPSHISIELASGAQAMNQQSNGEDRLPLAALATTVFAVFVVALGYGTTLPLLPSMIERLLVAPDPAGIARHTSLLTGAFAIAPVLAARQWGLWSDRFGRAPILAIGLIGFSITFAATAFQTDLPSLYLVRLFTGGFASAIVPSVLALVTDLERNDGRRARAFGWVSAASSIGLLAGPILGGVAADWSASVSDARAVRSVGLSPFLAVAGLAIAATLAIVSTLPRGTPSLAPALAKKPISLGKGVQIRLIALSAVVAAGLGVFEVGLALRAQTLSIAPSTLGLMFAGCMVTMLLVQAFAFSPMIKPTATRWFIAPLFLIQGFGLVLIPLSGGETGLVGATAAVAASGGLLAPLLAYWLSYGVRNRAGAQLGLQSAAVSIGQTLGSTGAAFLFDDYGASALVLGALATVSAAGALTLVVPLGGLTRAVPAEQTA